MSGLRKTLWVKTSPKKIKLDKMTKRLNSKSSKDHWIYKNPKALKSLMKGIKDTEEGRLLDLGSFAKYAIDDRVSLINKSR